ncbi:mucosa-associated lymphoid tissue lymphoma translocation protein 1 homolog isoform X1 [Myxocyprinus asiaticus]|uniref:mucosa-associated lymphoid tissue lymphoma translocation protein 1 homolog isoform X1 n=2 Tax=Myxocyprinus asiaticus TaxID=70543 RepID=UPI0022223BB6|nr:mucosa-associated lymphoid tissue lymphoma translocation protein 1 homolog isoform X1 [Myxocyprinus asiaticus]
MEGMNLGVGTLNEAVLNRLGYMLDNLKCGWKQLAKAVAEQPQFSCSDRDLTECSLKVLSANGSPGRYLLALLADRGCTLDFLLQCLRKIEHREAVGFLTTQVMEQIAITMQPQSQRVPEGSPVILSCKAVGPLELTYQWFKGKDEVPGGNVPELLLNCVGSAQQGHYICRVSFGDKFVFSKWAHVRLLRSGGASAGPSGSYFPSSSSGLYISQHPRAQALVEGDTLYLECAAQANPPPQFQWYHNRQPMPKSTRSFLKIPCITTADRGTYTCRVYNLYHEMWSDQVQVNIGPGSFSDVSWETTEVDTPDAPPKQMGDFCATDKVALLMGNMNYQHHRQLRAPMADVHELTNLLRQLDFKVVSLLDLNWQEMHSAVTEFLLLLDRGVYGLLYFAGHGYENYGNSFMVPIDAPASHTSKHCVCVQDVLQRMQERETGLNVFLLDMCRKRNPNDDSITQTGPLKVTANIVFGYATCVDAEAFEVNKEDLSNGIFMSYLKKRLMDPEKVTVLLDKVAEDMGKCEITRGRQALELRSNLSERRALTDRIQAPACPITASTRNLQWAIAHVLPDSRCLEFKSGVKVQLGFAAEFSNIMIIYTRILETPKDIESCSAQLADFAEGPEVDLKHSNQESLQEAGSLLLTMDDLQLLEQPQLFTRISALQRLKMELSFTVCLHYKYTNLDEELVEEQKVSIGKPLVSKLNLHEPRLPRAFSASSSLDLQMSSILESSSFSEDFKANLSGSDPSSIGSASTTWSYYQRPSESLLRSDLKNEPEESISPEFLESEEPPAIKSLPSAASEELPFKFSNLPNSI